MCEGMEDAMEGVDSHNSFDCHLSTFCIPLQRPKNIWMFFSDNNLRKVELMLLVDLLQFKPHRAHQLSRQTKGRPICYLHQRIVAAQTSFPQIRISATTNKRQTVSISRPVYSTLSAVSTKSHALPLQPQTRADQSSTVCFNTNKASCPRLWVYYRPCVQTWESSRWANTTNFYK